MDPVTLDQAIDAAMRLDPAARELLVEILRNRQIDAERQSIADDAADSVAAFRAGTLRAQTASEVIRELDRTIDSASGEEVLLLLDMGTHDAVY